jgi:ubiquinone biosynthesis protein
MEALHVGDLTRIRQIVTVLNKHGFGRFLVRGGFGRFLPDDATKGEEGGVPWPERVREAITELGPTYVKLGQVLSVRPDIVPNKLAVELQKLQDRVPPVSYEAIREVLEAELGGPVASFFKDFSETPLAAASIAQVHAARLEDGTPVAVKIQRPDIVPVIAADIRILMGFARMLERELQLPGVYTPSEIVKEFDAALHQELDFTLEARNCERFRASMKDAHPDVLVPKVYPERSTRRVLVLERVEGSPASVLHHEDPRAPAYARKVLACEFTQVFENGFYHGDPHPGNLFILPDDRLAYLDFGLVGVITAEMQREISAIFVSLVFRDAEGLALAVYRAGGMDGRVDLRAFRGEVSRLMEKYNSPHLADLAVRENLLEIIEVASRHRIRLPREFAVLARAAALTYGLTQKLLPNVDIIQEVRPLAERLVTKELDPAKVASEAAKLLLHARTGLAELPLQLNQLMGDLEGGRLRFTIQSPDVEKLGEEVRRAGVRVVLTVFAAGLSIAGAILVAPSELPVFGIPLSRVLGAVSILGSGLLWVSVVAHTQIGPFLSIRGLGSKGVALVRFFLGARND